MSRLEKGYTNGEVTIHWKGELCQHSGNCVRGLGPAFHPVSRPWITPEKATMDQVIATVKRWPSGALAFTDHRSDLVRVKA
jgi:uncharacterized Fe-S cluster protein YjdI